MIRSQLSWVEFSNEGLIINVVAPQGKVIYRYASNEGFERKLILYRRTGTLFRFAQGVSEHASIATKASFSEKKFFARAKECWQTMHNLLAEGEDPVQLFSI